MPSGSIGGGYGALRVLFEEGAIGVLSDAELLDRFLECESGRAEAAFSVLVDRHGAMVLSVCRRVLGDPHDAQDAFQATFLTLARRAGAIRRRDSAASWLFGVALCVSTRMRDRRSRRRNAEQRAIRLRAVSEATDTPVESHDWVELHEELARLPETYRAPAVLCYMEELTNEEAAARLRVPVGTVKTRLKRARDLLRNRLTRRGEAFPVVLATALRREPSAAVSAQALSRQTSHMAVISLSGLSNSAIPPAVALLSRGALVASFAAKCVAGAAGVLIAVAAVGVLVTSSAFGDRSSGAITPIGVVLPDESVSAKKAASDQDDPDLGPNFPVRSPSITAPVLSGITVDGDLSDWPEPMVFHPVDQLFAYNGSTLAGRGLKVSDQIPEDDLRATFATGYDPETQLLYLAVIVRDDAMVVSNDSHLNTDAVEVYVDGFRSESKFTKEVPSGKAYWEAYDLSELPVQQYVSIPGDGPIYGVDAGTNPIVMAGDLKQTKTRSAYRRDVNTTTYEWAIEVFDRYPDTPTRLVPGKRIGFDLAVADQDHVGEDDTPPSDQYSWIYWGPQWKGIKVWDAGNLGELVLGDRPSDFSASSAPDTPEPTGPTRLASAEARPISGIKIDGDLSDWPKDIPRHEIDHVQVLPPFYGWNGLEGDDLATSPDLSPSFSVAYDEDQDLIYLAVIVRDDELVVGHDSFQDTDAVEVYVDGRHSKDSVPASAHNNRWETADASEFPVLQYIGIPGEGRVYGVRRTSGEDRGADNPILMSGDIHRTNTQMAFRRETGQTVYEWAIQAFDRYPDTPSDLFPGKRIGFDVAVVDKDRSSSVLSQLLGSENEPPAWVSWYPEYDGLRFLNAANLGELVLSEIPWETGGSVTED